MTGAARTEPAPDLARSLPGVLSELARREPGHALLTALDRHGATVAALTAAELDTAARSLASVLVPVTVPGDRVLVPAMSALRFQVAFLACLYARLVAVPVPPIPVGPVTREDGKPSRRFARLVGICRDVEPAAAVVPGRDSDALAAAWSGEPALGRIRLVAAEERGDAAAVTPAAADGGDLAFLQYTSGSTSAPRGVMITHGAMLANQAMLCEHMGIARATTIVSWLPVYHDMGLCLGLLQPLYAGAAATLFEPETFLLRPERWLEAIAACPDAMTAAPDFAYAWAARRVKDAAKAGLDLSGWRVAVNGAEPVRAATLRAFQDAFAGYGLGERTLTPAYGLAESTLFVTGGSGRTAPVVRSYERRELGEGRAVPAGGEGTGRVELAGCGRPAPGVRVAIVDPRTRRRRPERAVGEIWVDSASNGAGYWGRGSESAQTFAAVLAAEPPGPAGPAPEGADAAPPAGGGRWLRTGDLGFLDGGELFVTGRHKDLIVVHGVNYYPQDFEQLVTRAHPLFDGQLAAACAVEEEHRVVVAVEAADRRDHAAATEAAAAAVRAVTAELPVTTDVVVVPRGRLPRTTSGKVRRGDCAGRLREGALPELARWPRDPGRAAPDKT